MTEKVLLAVISIGDNYRKKYAETFEDNHKKYASKVGYDFKVVSDFLDKSDIKSLISFQKILVCGEKWSTDYDYIIVIDADIFISENTPPIHVAHNFKNKIGIVNEYSQPTKEKRIEIQRKNGWETSASEYYKLAGFDIDTDMVFNTGVMVLQPQKHKDFLNDIYNKHKNKAIGHYRGFHFEQSAVGYELQKANLFVVMDNVWNTIRDFKENDNYYFLHCNQSLSNF